MESLYKDIFGHEPSAVSRLDGAGSSRIYSRLSGDPTVIATIGADKRENEAFIYLSRKFSECGLPVPEVFGKSDDGLMYLQSDLGDVSLFDLIISDGAGSVKVRKFLSDAIRLLPEFQFRCRDLDIKQFYPRAKMDLRSAMWDLNYFKYCFLKAVMPDFDEDRLEDDFQTMASIVVRNPEEALMLRDFQSRNVMIHAESPYVIDFQGARYGSCLYDVASFLWQARAGFSSELRQSLISEYVDAVRCVTGMDIENLAVRLDYMVLFRTLQVLGAYGYRGYFEKKAHFVTSIVPAVNNLKELLGRFDFGAMPYLSELLKRMVSLRRFASKKSGKALTVRVISFSYKKGVPDDFSGNGGGFVFDCRAIHNPGRYDEYKSLTGTDVSVREFLERDGEMAHFLDSCYKLVDYSVEQYVRRGFTDLMVCFGCTGGRHRSVYGAESMARHLIGKYGVTVTVSLEHREQGITRICPER